MNTANVVTSSLRHELPPEERVIPNSARLEKVRQLVNDPIVAAYVDLAQGVAKTVVAEEKAKRNTHHGTLFLDTFAAALDLHRIYEHATSDEMNAARFIVNSRLRGKKK